MDMHLKNLVNSLPRRPQDITRREGNPTKYYPEELYTQCALFRAKIIYINKAIVYPRYSFSLILCGPHCIIKYVGSSRALFIQIVVHCTLRQLMFLF
jgi:hypothetical protein